MDAQTRQEKSKSPVMQSVTIKGMLYQSRLVNCGKKNCTRCNPKEGPQQLHGPYWYLCVSTQYGYRRLYLGKSLDPNKFRNADGSVDTRALQFRRGKGDIEDKDAPKGAPSDD